MAKTKAIPVDTGKAEAKTPLQLRQDSLAKVGEGWLGVEEKTEETVSKALETIRPYVKPMFDAMGVVASETEAEFADQVYLGHITLFGELVSGSAIFRAGLESLAFQCGVMLTAESFPDRLYQYSLASLKGKRIKTISFADDAWLVIAMSSGLTINGKQVKALRNVFAKISGLLNEMGYYQRKPSAKATAKAETPKAETTPPNAEPVISKEITAATIVEGVIGQTKFTLLDLIRESVVSVLKTNETPDWLRETFQESFLEKCMEVANPVK